MGRQEMDAAIAALVESANENDSVDNSAIAVLEQLLNDAEAAKGDPAAVQAVVDRYRASSGKLAAAIANVPAGGGNGGAGLRRG